MNVLAIYAYGYIDFRKDLSKPLNDFRCIQIGFGAVLTNILKKGHKVNLQVYTQHCDIDKFVDEAVKGKYDLICITAVTTHIAIIKNLVKEIKKKLASIKILIGGPHVTLFPEDIGKDKIFDAICIGEGFKTIGLYLDYLAGKIKADEVLGFWIREKGHLLKNDSAQFCEFREFPIINREIWAKHVENTQMHSVLVSRGCPNNCSFCSNHILKTKNSGTYVQFRDTDDIIKEIKSIVKKYRKADTIFLETETFNIDLNYAYKLLNALEIYNSNLKNKLKFYTNLLFNENVKNDKEKFAKKLKAANFIQVTMGLESGSERIRKNILHRPPYTNKDFIEFCRYLQKHGILVALNVMVGLPTETKQDINKTIAILDKISPDLVMPSIFNFYPGTDIYKYMLKNKMIKEKVFSVCWDERRTASFGSDCLSKKDIQQQFQYLCDRYEKANKRRIETVKFLNKIQK